MSGAYVANVVKSQHVQHEIASAESQSHNMGFAVNICQVAGQAVQAGNLHWFVCVCV
jgi:hypothetical protein